MARWLFLFWVVLVYPALAGRVPFDAPLRTLKTSKGEQIRKIVLFSLNPFLGDQIIEFFPLITAYHRIFGPEVKIYVVCPAARVLEETEWLKPVPFRLEDYFSDRDIDRWALLALEEADRLKVVPNAKGSEGPSGEMAKLSSEAVIAMNHVAQDKVVPLLGPDTLVYYRPSAGCLLYYEWARRGFFKEYELVRNSLELVEAVLVPSLSLFFDFQHADYVIPRNSGPSSDSSILEGDENVYLEQWESFEHLFPSLKKPYGVPASLFKPAAPSGDLKRYLIEQGLDATRPFLVLNWNAGPDKNATRLDWLKAHAVMLPYLIQEFPELNILVTSPDDLPGVFEQADKEMKGLSRRAFGKKLAQDRLFYRMTLLATVQRAYLGQTDQVRELVDELNAPSKRIAFLPKGGYALVDRAVEDAKAVISRDTGFVHLAYARRGLLDFTGGVRFREEVFTISLKDGYHSAYQWSLPFQPHFEVEFGDPKEEDGLLNQLGDLIRPSRALAECPLRLLR